MDDTEELIGLVERLLEHFEMDDGYPSIQVYSRGEPIWGVVDDPVADLLYAIKEIVD